MVEIKNRDSGAVMTATTQLTASHPVPPADPKSAGEWKDLLEEILPPQGVWSEEEYLVLTDHRNRLIEYTDGFLEVLPTPTMRHQLILQTLFLAFHGFFDSRGGIVLFAALRLR